MLSYHAERPLSSMELFAWAIWLGSVGGKHGTLVEVGFMSCAQLSLTL